MFVHDRLLQSINQLPSILAVVTPALFCHCIVLSVSFPVHPLHVSAHNAALVIVCGCTDTSYTACLVKIAQAHDDDAIPAAGVNAACAASDKSVALPFTDIHPSASVPVSSGFFENASVEAQTCASAKLE